MIKYSDYKAVRNKTLELVKSLNAEDMMVQANDYVSPIKWHLAHTTWFFEKFVLKKKKKYKSFSKSFDFLFNSYYLGLGSFNEKKSRGLSSRPYLDEILEYRKYIDGQILDLFSMKNEIFLRFIYLIQLGINHEQQHQELILMDILNNFYNNPMKPSFMKKKKLKKIKHKEVYWTNSDTLTFKFGGDKRFFSYDNELPTGEVELHPFKLNVDFVTNKDWLDFIDNDGYDRPEFWLSDGWDFIKKHQINKPLYWLNNKYEFTLFGIEKIDYDKPVAHISFYESDAYARYKKKRLPSEFELEFFLKSNKKKGNFLEDKKYEKSTISSENFSDNAYGNLWSWTKSNYLPYPGYKPFKNKLTEYNQKFMCNQFVLKGGSYGTPKNHIRASYRNFYYPRDRWHFCGLRLVEDLV